MVKIMHKTAILFLVVGLTATPSLCFPQEQAYHLNKVIDKLEKGKLVTGIWGLSQSFGSARGIIEFNGFPTQEEAINKPMIDFVLVAMEHYPFDITALRAYIAGLNSKQEVFVKGNLQPSLAVFVRIPPDGSEPVHAIIKQVLDAGAHGVVVPHVRTPDEALKIVQACRYIRPANAPYREPKGTRGYSPSIAAYNWGISREEYYRRADVWPLNPEGDIMVIIMIEDPEGVQNIDAILKVPGLGGVVFGPADYTIATGNFGNAEFDVNRALNIVKKACDSAGVPLVGFADPGNIAQKVKERYRMLIIGSDIDMSGSAGKTIDFLRGLK